MVTFLFLLTTMMPKDIAPEVEVAFWSGVYGVDPRVAIGVQEQESGGLPEQGGMRDSIVSLGNIGRFQINCKTFRAMRRTRDCDQLQNRHINIFEGVRILAEVQRRFAKGERCRCSGHYWVSHYNAGEVVCAGSFSERYGRRVMARARQMHLDRRLSYAFLAGTVVGTMGSGLLRVLFPAKFAENVKKPVPTR